MRTFYALNVSRKDGSSRRHVMQGELPKVGDTVVVMIRKRSPVAGAKQESSPV
jgi:hypothetical protein